MIKKIGVENFRVFRDYTEFEIRPITILIGPNGSGKSSLIKFINLVQNSFCGPSNLNVLNFETGKHLLGTYSNALSWNSNSKHLKIVVDFPLDVFDEEFQLELIYERKNENALIKSFKVFNDKINLFSLNNISKSFHNTSQGVNQYLVKYNLTFDSSYLKYTEKINNIDFSKKEPISSEWWDYWNSFYKIDENETIRKNYFNQNGTKGIDYPLTKDEWLKQNYKSEYFELLSKSRNRNIYFFRYKNFNQGEDPILLSELEDYYLSNRTEEYSFITKSNGDDLLSEIFNQPSWEICNGMEDGYRTYVKNNPKFNKYINKNSQVDWVMDDAINFHKNIFKNIKNRLNVLFKNYNNINYLNTHRGVNERVISKKESPLADKIIKEFSQLNFDEIQHKTHFEFLQRALEILEVKGDLIIERIEGTVSIVYLKCKDKNISIADMGYGFSQIIPVILKIILTDHQKEFFENSAYHYTEPVLKTDLIKKHENSLSPLLIIEEPEANLHPKLQSKLAEIFALAHQKFGINFIIESHSEYFIRKLQYLTAKKEIRTEDSIIYYFNDDKYVSEEEPKVKPIEITETGGLTDTFGPGFFDETTRIQFALAKLNKTQNK